jgi:hypothetical protein
MLSEKYQIEREDIYKKSYYLLLQYKDILITIK